MYPSDSIISDNEYTESFIYFNNIFSYSMLCYSVKAWLMWLMTLYLMKIISRFPSPENKISNNRVISHTTHLFSN